MIGEKPGLDAFDLSSFASIGGVSAGDVTCVNTGLLAGEVTCASSFSVNGECTLTFGVVTFDFEGFFAIQPGDDAKSKTRDLCVIDFLSEGVLSILIGVSNTGKAR